MTQRQAIVKTWRNFKRFIKDGTCPPHDLWLNPFCEYDQEREKSARDICNNCPLMAVRGRFCSQYKCIGDFEEAVFNRNDAAAKRHAGAVVRVLERLILSQGWKVPRK